VKTKRVSCISLASTHPNVLSLAHRKNLSRCRLSRFSFATARSIALVNDSVSARAKHGALNSRSVRQPCLSDCAGRWLQCTLVTSQRTLIDQSELWRRQSALHCSQRPVQSNRHGWWTTTSRLVYWLTQHTSMQSTSSPNSAENISIFALFNSAKS